MTSEASRDRLRFYTIAADTHQPTFAEDVANGLNTTPQKWLPPKYFYDTYGSQLYEQICDLPEYYPYRAEGEILSSYSTEIQAEIGQLALVEYGSGNAAKTRHLLAAYEQGGQPFRYCPVDISEAMLRETATQLLQEYRHISVDAMTADFAGRPEVVEAFDLNSKALAFLGSSMGNFTRKESELFLRRTARIMGPEDLFLLGIDLKKSPRILIPAYDDAQGVTAAFNLNVLRRINRELGGQFDLRNFEHVAIYNEIESRIEMHLRSRCVQAVPITKIEQTISFAAGETIHTENSCKYSVEDIQQMGYQANLELRRTWFDRQRHFLVALFRPC